MHLNFIQVKKFNQEIDKCKETWYTAQAAMFILFRIWCEVRASLPCSGICCQGWNSEVQRQEQLWSHLPAVTTVALGFTQLCSYVPIPSHAAMLLTGETVRVYGCLHFFCRSNLLSSKTQLERTNQWKWAHEPHSEDVSYGDLACWQWAARGKQHQEAPWVWSAPVAS